jgi:hypothetical protein
MTVEDEVRELRELLEAEDLVPGVALTAFDKFSAEARAAVIAETARQFDPPPSGRMLARLLPLVTDASRSMLADAYLANLRSSDPQARRSSLDGLAALEYPRVTDLALTALRDEDDSVVGSAVGILVPLAAQNDNIRRLLASLYAARRGDPGFYLTTTLIDAHGIKPEEKQ